MSVLSTAVRVKKNNIILFWLLCAKIDVQCFYLPKILGKYRVAECGHICLKSISINQWLENH